MKNKVILLLLFTFLGVNSCSSQNLVLEEESCVFECIKIGYKNINLSDLTVDTIWIDTLRIMDNWTTVTIFENKLIVSYDSNFRVYSNKCTFLYNIQVYELLERKLVRKEKGKFCSSKYIENNRCLPLLVILKNETILLEYKRTSKKEIPINWENLSNLESIITDFIELYDD